ncbi:MAG: hypothetical protein ACI8RZ_003887 [Myxococcota bacterium]|jgi:hypothetical protein
MFLSVAAVLSISTAAAGPTLDTTLTLPSSMDVDVADTISVKVKNTGNGHAQDVSLTIQLPETNTSPTVYVLGDIGSYSSSCVESGTTLVCDIGRIKKNKTKTVTFDIALPWSFDTLDFEATASASNASSSSDTDYATVLYVDEVLSGTNDITNQHCTGTDLVAFYECRLFPSSISSHSATLTVGGSVTISGQPGYGGSWGQDDDDHLWFEYTYNGSIVAEFEGNGVGGSCFEGLSSFPGSSFVAPYEVCID